MRLKLFLGFLAAIALWLVFALDGEPEEPSAFFEAMRARLHVVEAFYRDAPYSTAALFFVALVLAATVGFPPPGLITIGAAAVMGFWPAFAVSLPAAAIGAVVPFAASRRLIGPILEKRFPERTAAMRAGFALDGPFYLFSLRLVPLVPFPVVNLFMGVTTIGAGVFVGVSMLGRAPLTALYCNAGIQLAAIRGPGDILTPDVVLSLAALAVFPHVARFAVRILKARRA